MEKLGSILKNIKETYGLQSKDMADIMAITYRSYFRYENNIIEQSLDKYCLLSHFFAISLDYLSGMVEYEYNEALTKRLEKTIMADVKKVVAPYKLPEKYTSLDSRVVSYSLEERSKIIALTNITKKFYLPQDWHGPRQEFEYNNMIEKIKAILDK